MQQSDLTARDRAQTGNRASRRHRARLGCIALAAAASALSSATVAAPAFAASQHRARQQTYSYATLDNAGDPTFNQLLGINNSGLIAGYFGSGAAGHPNQGYELGMPYAQSNYAAENVPESTQTQVTGLNDRGVTVGFWSDTDIGGGMDANFGFWSSKGHFHTVIFPSTSHSTPEVNQLLGVNNADMAVGFYTDANGDNHGYTYDLATDTYSEVTIAGSDNVTAAAINNRGDIAGFYTNPATGNTDGFLMTASGRLTDLAVPGASATQALGVNDKREVVGDYTVGTGDSAVTHGFTWTLLHGFTTVDDPNGIGGTTVNGLNNAGDLVGFYTDAAGNVDGLLATPQS